MPRVLANPGVSRMRTLGKGYAILMRFNIAGTYHPAVFASKSVEANRGGPTVFARTALLIGIVEKVEVIMTNVVPGKDIGDEFQD